MHATLEWTLNHLLKLQNITLLNLYRRTLSEGLTFHTISSLTMGNRLIRKMLEKTAKS